MRMCLYESPLGPLKLVSNGQAITELAFDAPGHACAPQSGPSDAALDRARRELDLYFAGKLRSFTVAVAPKGTPFQQRAWADLCAIPYGATRTYPQQAAAIDAPRAARAVGSANGRNRVAIIIPCHRVIGAGGALTGYAGGTWRKRFLLELEQGRAALVC